MTRRKAKMGKIGKGTIIIVVMLIAFFSASFIATVHAQTQNVTINNTVQVEDGSGANLPMNFEVNGVQTDITSFNWEIGSIYTITQLVTTFNDQYQLVPDGFQYGDNITPGDTLSYTVTSDPDQTITFTPDLYVGVYVLTNGVGSVSPDGFQWIYSPAYADGGNQLQITATPTNPNQVFEGWTITDPNGAGNSIDDSSATSTIAEIWDYGTITADFYQPPQVNVGITSVSLTPVTAPVGDSSLQNVGVTVDLQNDNPYVELLNITLTTGSTWLAWMSTSIGASASATSSFSGLDFSSFPAGTYTITAYVTTVGLNLSPATMTTTQTVTITQPQPSTPVQIDSVQVPSIATQTGFTMPINVTLTNPDTVQETADIQVTMNATSVFNTTVTLNALQTEAVPCYFNTSTLAIGNYTYTVTVTTTILTGSPVITATGTTGVTYLGDLNGDFKVNFSDLMLFVQDYIAFNTNGIYNSAADYNNDGRINFQDIQLFVSAYIEFSAS